MATATAMRPRVVVDRSEGRGAEAAEPRLVEAEAVLGGARVVRIRHRGEVYVLRVTRAGKLILTK